MNVALRLADPTHLDALLPLVRAYHAFEGIAQDERVRLAALGALLASEGPGRVWLIVADGALAGYLIVCFGYSVEFGGRDAFLDEFFIVEAQRGRGIGARALALVQAETAALGVRALHLEVARDNARARRLYAAAGFEARSRYVLMSCPIKPWEEGEKGRREDGGR
mgnify:CR=1 FL=1